MFLNSLPSDLFEHLRWVLYLALSGMLFSFILNLLSVIYAIRKQGIKHQDFKDWMVDHFCFVYLVIGISTLNSQIGRILTSNIFGLSMFSGPRHEQMEAELKFFSLASTIFHEAIALGCQIYTTYYLDTFFTVASLGFIYNGIRIIMDIIKKCFKFRGRLQIDVSQDHIEMRDM